MNKHITLLFVLATIVFNSCKSPINTNISEPSSVLSVESQYDNNKRIVDTLHVKLKWSEITIDNFDKIKISRLNMALEMSNYPEGADENGWLLRTNITNAFATSWMDTIYDDSNFKYRIEFYDTSNNFKRAETVVYPRPTTHFIVPTDINAIETAVESSLMDNGDTVFVRDGKYDVKSFSIRNKNILLTNMPNSGTPLIKWTPTFNHNGDVLPDSSYIYMNSGTIRGFIINGGKAYFGGGILAEGTTQIINCGIFDNIATSKHGGDGGGLYLSGNAKVSNSIIFNNRSSNLGGGIFIDDQATNVIIENCTIVANNLFTESQNAQIINSIFWGSALPLEPTPSVKYSYAGLSWFNLDSSNIIGNLIFNNPNLLSDPESANMPGSFRLTQESVGINHGNPDAQFNDVDGSRNDIGAYGGPLGNWNLILLELD